MAASANADGSSAPFAKSKKKKKEVQKELNNSTARNFCELSKNPRICIHRKNTRSRSIRDSRDTPRADTLPRNYVLCVNFVSGSRAFEFAAN